MENIILQLNNLSIGYTDPLLSGINAEIKKGETTLLIGKNGSGKTTLLKTIFKYLPTLQGTIGITGQNLSDFPVSEIGKLISVVLSKSTISPSLKVFDLIALGRYPYKKWYQKLTDQEISDINNTIHLLELDKYKNYFVSELSDGNLQKTLIARALIQDCPMLILDEPTSHLDIPNKLEIMKILNLLAKEKGKTILFTSHDLNLGMAIADKLWLIKDTELKTGYAEDIAYKENILEYFSGESLEFDYNSNEYKFINTQEKKEVKVTGNSQAIYWLRKALSKNLFSLSDEAETIIEESCSIFRITKKDEEHYASSIQEVIKFLS